MRLKMSVEVTAHRGQRPQEHLLMEFEVGGGEKGSVQAWRQRSLQQKKQVSLCRNPREPVQAPLVPVGSGWFW